MAACPGRNFYRDGQVHGGTSTEMLRHDELVILENDGDGR